jgi:hypothetical protein
MAPARNRSDARHHTGNIQQPSTPTLYGYATGPWSGLSDDVGAMRSPHSPSPDASASSRDTPPLDSVPPGQEIQVANPHTRTYQACDECRRRKIKCDMGPVDNPHGPPCARCRRENRECTFAPTRRKKRKAKEEEDEEEIPNGAAKRKSIIIQQTPVPIDPAVASEEEDHSLAVLQRHEINSGYDSLNMLISAAEGLSKEPDAPSNAELSNQIAAWERLQFVRRGWFTAKEGIAYIDYFYKYLLPLTPLSLSLPQEYNIPSKQFILLEQEPFLLVVVLTIASRYMKLAGTAACSRQSAIHDKLWAHLRGMVERTFWAQEQFGGGLCGAGPKSRDFQGLRTLGTVEGFMLLTDWHPRALHFPPSNDDDLMAPVISEIMDTDSESTLLLNGTGGQRRDSWLEPCWRSDRMCWMLLGHAISLAFEIGVFENENSSDLRKSYLRKLLSVYFILLSGRLELIGKLPGGYLDALSSDMNRAMSHTANLFNGANGTSGQTESTNESVLYLWQSLASIMKVGNEELFANTEETRNLLRSGRYSQLINEHYQPKLEKWWDDLQQSQVSSNMRSILAIEYEYCRVYLNSLAMQAVVERCINNSPVQRHVNLHNGTNTHQTGMAIPPAKFKEYYRDDDRKHIAAVTSGCQNILKIVTDERRGEFLKHCSVRTYFRIIATAVILLKTFALGAPESDVQLSLNLFDRLIVVFRANIVDDVHVGNRFADMCETLVRRIRSRFVRMSRNGGAPSSNNGYISRPESPGLLSLGLPTDLSSGMPPPQQRSTPYHSVHVSRASSTGPSSSLVGFGGMPAISAEMYNQNTHTIVPPPAMAYDEQGQYVDMSGFDPNGAGLNGEATADWISLPLDPLFNVIGADIDSTSLGPSVGGFDMLDVLLQNNKY